MSRFFAAALAVLAALAFAGCGAEVKTPDATEAPASSPDPEASEARILQLAEACDEFGEFDYVDGVRQSEAERMIYCLYRFNSDESEVAGYTRVEEAEALKALSGVFPSMELPKLMRTKYDQSGEQEVFFLNNAFYVKMCGPQVRTYRLVSETAVPEGQAAGGVAATVEALEGGAAVKQIKLALTPDVEAGWSVVKCEFLYLN